MTSTSLSRTRSSFAAAVFIASTACGVSVNAWATPIDIHHPEEEAFADCQLKGDTYVNCCLKTGGTLSGDAAKPLCRLPYQDAAASDTNVGTGSC